MIKEKNIANNAKNRKRGKRNQIAGLMGLQVSAFKVGG